MRFSFIIINYNTRQLIDNCLKSIVTNCSEGQYEIIVVDNNSRDGSQEMMEKKYKNKIKLIKNAENKGFGLANNQAAEISSGEFLFLLNSDTLIKKNVLTHIKEVIDSQDRVGIVAPRLVLENGLNQPYAFGSFPNLSSIVADKFYSSRKYKKEIFEADWVSGAALIISNNLFDRLGGFDKIFFMYFEDIDLCKRVKDLGFKIVIAPQISVTHLLGRSPSRFSKRKNFYYLSQNYYFKKHFGVLYMSLMRIIRFPYRLISSVLGS